jgi:hypothetical protein
MDQFLFSGMLLYQIFSGNHYTYDVSLFKLYHSPPNRAEVERMWIHIFTSHTPSRHNAPSSVEVKNGWTIPPIPHMFYVINFLFPMCEANMSSLLIWLNRVVVNVCGLFTIAVFTSNRLRSLATRRLDRSANRSEQLTRSVNLLRALSLTLLLYRNSIYLPSELCRAWKAP